MRSEILQENNNITGIPREDAGCNGISEKRL